LEELLEYIIFSYNIMPPNTNIPIELNYTFDNDSFIYRFIDDQPVYNFIQNDQLTLQT